MKITFVTGEFYPVNGGVSNAALGFSKALVKYGYDVSVITPKVSSEHSSRELYCGIKIIRVKCSNFLTFMVKSLIWVKKLNPDIVFGEMIWTGGTVSGIAGKIFNIIKQSSLGL